MKIFIACVLSLCFLHVKSQHSTSFTLTNIKSTMIEAGVLHPSFKVDEFSSQYKKSIFLYSSSNYILIIKNKFQSDSIFFSKMKKSRKVVDNELLQRYPDDNLNQCIEDSMLICDFSKSFRKLLNVNTISLYYSNGYKINYNSADTKRYLLFYLSSKNLALFDIENSIILFLKNNN